MTTNTRALSPSGFTLIELILSLTILAALGSIVLTTLTEAEDLKRYEETENRGEQIQAAVLGTPAEPSRFLADLGRFPLVVMEKEGCELMELYAESIMTNMALRYATRILTLDPARDHFSFGGLHDFAGTVNPLSVAAITLGAGWRGPYLTWRHETLTDHWGRPWELAAYDAASQSLDWRGVTASDVGSLEIRGIRTLGRDGVDEVEEDTSAPNTYPDEIQTFTFSSNALYAAVTVQLFTLNMTPPYERPVASNHVLRVFLYQPVCTAQEAGLCEVAAWRNAPGQEGVDYRVQTDAQTVPDRYEGTNALALTADYPMLRTTAHWGPALAAWQEVTFHHVPLGVRKLWAYAYVPGEPGGLRSPLSSFEIQPGRTSVLNLYLTEAF